ncbi:MAG: hypothetical protein R3Y11_00165 [Pseudomonadota bacterium]
METKQENVQNIPEFADQYPDASSPISGEQVELGSARKPLDIVGAIQRYLRIIILFGMIAFLCMLPIAITASSPYYMATGSILVERVRAPIIASTEQSSISNFFYDYAQTEVMRLGNTSILHKTLESLPLEIKNFLAPDGITAASIQRLRSSLTIGLIPNTHLIMVQMRSNIPSYATEVVNVLMKTYIKHTEETAENKDARRIDYLTKEHKILEYKVKNLTQQLMKLAKQTRTATFVEAYNVESLRLIELQKALTVAYRDKLISENQNIAVKSKAKSIRQLSTEALSDELVAGDESLWSISYWTYKTLQEMRASIDGISRTNPDRQYIESRMKAMKAYETKLKENVTERAERIVHDKREYELTKESLTAEATAFASDKTYKELLESLQLQQEIASKNSSRIIEAQMLETNLAQSRDRLYAVETRMQELHAESKSPVRASVEEFAQNSDQPAGTNRKKFIMLSAFSSFGGIGFIFLMMELLDNRVRSGRDLIAATEHSPSWPISLWQGEGDFWQLTSKHPQAEGAKAIRSLAIRLHKERALQSSNSAQIAVFMGVSNQVGTSSIAINTARALAGLGSKILYIQTQLAGDVPDKKQDSMEQTANTATGHDFVCTLQGDDPLGCIQKPAQEDFDIMTFGSDWGHGHDGKLSFFLHTFRSEYEFIVADAAPLLDSDFTEYLLLESHVAVLIVQANRTKYADLRKTLEVLWRLHIPAMTTVLNHGGPLIYTRAETILRKLPRKFLALAMPHLVQKDYTLNKSVRSEHIWNVKE